MRRSGAINNFFVVQIMNPNFSKFIRVVAFQAATLPTLVGLAQAQESRPTGKQPESRPTIANETARRLVYGTLEQSKAEVMEIYNDLAKAGYDINAQISKKPLLINNKPVIVIAVGDVHTPKGAKFTTSTLDYIRKFGPTDLFIEGASADPLVTEIAIEKLKNFDAERVTPNVMTAQEKKAADVHDAPPTENTYTAPNYKKLPGYTRIFGMESRDVWSMYLFNLFGYAGMGLDAITEQGKNSQVGLCELSVNGKYITDTYAKMDASLKEIEAILGMYAPRWSAVQRKTIEYKPGFVLEGISPEDLAKFIPDWTETFRRYALVCRNGSCAHSVLDAYISGELKNPRIAFEIGQDHLKHFWCGEPEKSPTAWSSLPEHLVSMGISCVYIFPKD